MRLKYEKVIHHAVVNNLFGLGYTKKSCNAQGSSKYYLFVTAPFFVISPKLYGIYYIEEDHLMKKSRIERVKKYSMLSLIEDLGFTLVYESSNYYHLEEHDSLKIRVNINRFYWYSKGFGGDTITLCQTLGLEKNPEFHSFIYTILYLEMRMYKNPHHEFKRLKDKRENLFYHVKTLIIRRSITIYMKEALVSILLITLLIMIISIRNQCIIILSLYLIKEVNQYS